MSKKDLTEQEIRTRYITPAIQDAGWLPLQIREEVYITAGKIRPRGRMAPRGKHKRADTGVVAGGGVEMGSETERPDTSLES